MDMKKFSLKPLGDSCMKMLCKSCFFIGLLMTFCLTACSDDDDDTVTPIFPEKQNIVCNAGEKKEFTFTANTNWSLASSTIWCKFQNNDTEEFVVSGTAGTQTVTIMATNENQNNDNASVAKLELTMGGQTIVIGEVTRSAARYELKIFDEEGVEINELKVGYQHFSKFSVQANFRFAATNLPGWVELEGGSLVGPVNQKVSGGLKIIEDDNREKYPVPASDKNVITFSDEEGKAFYSFNVSYDGMTPGVLEMTLPSSNKYDWAVSLDGKTFTQSAGGVAGTGGSTTTLKNRVPFTVKTLNDDYEVVFVEKGSNNNDLYIMDASYNEWMRCEREGGKATLIVDEYTPASYEPAERVGYVLVFSRAQYEDIKDNLEATIIDGEDLVYKYEQSNLVLQFTQKETKGGGDELAITAVDGQTYNPIDCTSYTGGDADYFKSEYGVTGIFEIKQPASVATVAKMPFNWSNSVCYYFEDEQEANGVTEPISETDITIYTEAANGKDVFLIVSDESGNKLMLIVRISNAGSGGGGDVPFTVTTSQLAPVSCTAYDGSMEGANYFITQYEVTDISDIKNPPIGESIFVTLNTSSIVDFKCYDVDEKIVDASSDIEISEDWSTGKQNLNVWLGNGSSLTKTVFLIITGEDGSKHMLVINI